MADEDLPAATVSVAPAADVIFAPTATGAFVHKSFPVRQPEEDANEIMVAVRGRVLKRIRALLGTLTTSRLPWPEILIGFSTMCLGGFLGAVASSLPWAVVNNGVAKPTGRAMLFYALLPMLGAASLVGFLALRHVTGQDAARIARWVLEDLPDPDHTL